DVPYSIFKNYSNYRGLITVRYAIESSQNIPMVKAMQQLGTENSIEFLKNVGIDNLVEEDNNLGLALGGLTKGTNTLKMAAAYGAIANDGVYIEPTFYTKVVDSNGNTVLEPHQESRTVMSKAAAYVVKEVLTQPVKTGTANYCGISGISVAAKTGTTNDDFDRWMCGFTPYYSAAVWYGYDENRTVKGWSTNPSGLIFDSILEQAHKGLEGKTFAQTKPDEVVAVAVCKDSGFLVTEACKNDPRGNRAYTEYFVKGTVPTKYCECHVKVAICRQTGLLANEFCTDKEEKVFITRPDYETNTAWKRAVDAKYMLTIKDTCTAHTQVADTTKPEIKLNGANNITIKINETYADAGATATDDRDGDITSKIKTTGQVDSKKEGTYTITYTVEDSAGNSATTERKVTVKAEEITASIPKITLNGSKKMKIKVGEVFTDPGATATDSKDGNLTDRIIINNNVNTAIAGTYTIKYTVRNSTGKEITAERTVVVEE
ncbi:MAG: DUF5011 domain-containing protein, partial [Clostridia bacterium]|nr:DUF5011 domain-containing protein [Clostridia bacterium]